MDTPHPLDTGNSLAAAHYEESLRLFQEQGDVFGVTLLVSALEVVGLPQGDEETARSLYEQSLPLPRGAQERQARDDPDQHGG